MIDLSVDFGKASDDVLGSDVFAYDTSLTVKTKAAGINLKAKVTGDQAHTIGISKYSPFDGFTIKKLETKDFGKVVAEASLDNVMDGLKFNFNVDATTGGDIKKTDIKIDYSTDDFISNTKIGALNKKISESLAFKYEDLWLGATGNFDLNSSEASGLAVGLYHSAGGNNLSCSLSLDDLNVHTTYQRAFDADTAIAGEFDYKNNDGISATVGFNRKLDATTTFSAKSTLSGSNSEGGIRSIPVNVALSTKLSDGVSFDAGLGSCGKLGCRFSIDI